MAFISSSFEFVYSSLADRDKKPVKVSCNSLISLPLNARFVDLGIHCRIIFQISLVFLGYFRM